MNRTPQTDPWLGEHSILLSTDTLPKWDGKGPRPAVHLMSVPAGYSVRLLHLENRGAFHGVRVLVTKDQPK